MTHPMTDRQAFEALSKLPFEFSIGGSLGLKMFGVIDRDIKDIDIVVPSLDIEYFLDKPKEGGSGEDVVVIRDGDVKIEVYEGNEDGIWVTNPYGKWFVSLPNYAIEAKKRYVAECDELIKKSLPCMMTEVIEARMNKHQKDIDAYEDWRNGGIELQKAIDNIF